MAETRDLTLAEMVESNRRMREPLEAALILTTPARAYRGYEARDYGMALGMIDWLDGIAGSAKQAHRLIEAALSYPERANG